jgi:UDP-N-acetylmuramoyl-L-alanyl-D-glutamate--2,6-diaminopimelate ligase
LKPEHIESHGSFENYKSAKATIFKNLHRGYNKNVLKTIIVNQEDIESKNFLEYQADKKLTFGVGSDSLVQGKIIEQNLYKNVFEVAVKNDSCKISMDLGGPFIVDNALAAIAITTSLGVELPVCKKALEKITNIAGRFEIVSKNPVIIVDYAHTVAAVEKMLSFVRKNWPGKIIHIFGAAGGGRDKWKRPLLADLSEHFTDFSILSEENSFDEPVEQILGDIYSGFKNKNRVAIIPERKHAVIQALSRADKDTLLLFTAKGSETVIAGPFGRKKPYNEKEFIQTCLSSKN